MTDFVKHIFNWLLCLTCWCSKLPAIGPFGPADDRPVLVRTSDEIPKHKFAILDFVGMVKHFGYPVEEHNLITEDGYKLKFHRVPGSPSSPKAPTKPVVLLQHGVMATSDVWVMFGPNISIVYFLADAGYDVWISNVRGNDYCRSHVTLSPDKDPKFWKFSMHEMAVLDTRAMIDYILHTTQEQSLIYVGHSMGTTIINMLLSKKPEYNDKLRIVFQIAPVVFFRHKIPPIVKMLVANIKLIKFFLGPYEELFPRGALNKLISESCRDDSLLQSLCIYITEFLNGSDLEQLDKSLLSTLFLYYPAGASKQSFYHYLQFLQTGQFREYDYGKKRNNELYNSSIPPEYNLSKVVAPVAIIYGDEDIIGFKENLQELVDALPNLVVCENVLQSRFNHIDFMNAKDVNRFLYKRILELMKYFPVNVTHAPPPNLPKQQFGEYCKIKKVT